MLNAKSQRRLVCNQLISPRNRLYERYVSAGYQRSEQVYQRSLYNCAKLHANRGVADISWHPQAARLVSAIHHPGHQIRLPSANNYCTRWFTGGLRSNSSWKWICSLPVVQGTAPGICTSKSWANTATSSSPEKRSDRRPSS